MDKDAKKKLKELGAGELASALLNLARNNDGAERLVEQLTTSEEIAKKRIKAELSKIKRSRKFYDWNTAGRLAGILEGVLDDIETSIQDPIEALRMIKRFFEIGGSVLESCDDSNGFVGGVYRFEASELFARTAQNIEDKKWVSDVLFELISGDDYSVCESIIGYAAEFLGESEMRNLIARFQQKAKEVSQDKSDFRWIYPVEVLARALKDPALFEKTRLAKRSEGPVTADCVRIAEAYSEAGDAATALEWLQKIPAGEGYMSSERDRLLLHLHRELENPEAREQTAWRIFRKYRTAETLEDLLVEIGDTRESVIESEASIILENPELETSDACFLIECGEGSLAEQYLLERRDQLDGGYYESVGTFAKLLEHNGFILGATVAYRALLDSILERGYTKAYYYGVRYLKKLDNMSKTVGDWKTLEDHPAYFAGLKEKHGLKRSFWGKYDGG